MKSEKCEETFVVVLNYLNNIVNFEQLEQVELPKDS